MRTASSLSFVVALIVLQGACAEPEATYHGEVRPILERHCVGCHTAGAIGPFALDSYKGAAEHAALIAAVTADRIMPPTQIDASGQCGTFLDSPWLTAEELADLRAWADDDAPEGDSKKYVAPTPDPIPTLEVTQVVTMAEPYTPKAELVDDLRCFVIDPELTEDRLLTAYRVVPGNTKVVHHVLLFAMQSALADQTVEAIDLAEEGPGYTCHGGPRAGNDYIGVLGWAPGTSTTRYPEDTGLRLSAGRKLVLQVHYNVSEAGPAADTTHIEMEHVPCDAQLQGRCFSPQEAELFPTGVFNLYLNPGQSYTTVTEDYDVGAFIGFNVRIWGVFPHMHKRGRTLRIEKTTDGATSCLADVPSWDFDWQRFYMFTEPLTIGPTDSIRITCGYDTKNDTDVVTWGEGTGDEMCLSFFYATL